MEQDEQMNIDKLFTYGKDLLKEIENDYEELGTDNKEKDKKLKEKEDELKQVEAERDTAKELLGRMKKGIQDLFKY